MYKICFIFFFFFTTNISYSQINKQLDTTITIDDTTKVHFKSISKKQYFSTKDDRSISFVKLKSIIKQNKSIFIKLQNNAYIELKDSSDEEKTDYVRFSYMGSFNNINFHLFTASYYEIGKCILINDSTGQKYEMFGEPKLSPSSKYFINASGIFNYDPFPNIIQLWNCSNGSLKLLFDFYPSDWVPEGIKWIEGNTVYFIQSFSKNINKYASIQILNN